MKTSLFSTSYALVLIVASFLVSGQIEAASSGNDSAKNQTGQEQNADKDVARHPRFENDRKQLIVDFYKKESQHNRCPPGLAKKNNGCNPPGKVKQWQEGRNLPSDVNYSRVPDEVLKLLGQPQHGYHYGMLDSDILLLMDVSELVIDAITDLDQ